MSTGHSSSAPQSNSGWRSPRSRQRSLKALRCGSPGLSMDRNSRGFPGELERDPSDEYRGSIPLGDAGRMPGEFQGNNNYPVWPYPDYFWPQYGGFHRESISEEEAKVTWHCGDLYGLSEWFPERMSLRSDSFALACYTTCNLFASFDQNNVCSLFGINVRQNQSPYAFAFDCDINFSYLLNKVRVTKNIKCNFRLESFHTHWKKKDFLSKVELGKIFQTGSCISCHIRVKELTNEGAKTTHSSSSGKDQLLPGSIKSARKSAVVEDSAAKKKRLATPNPTLSAPQSDSGSQPSGSVRSSAVLPPAYTARASTLTSAYRVPFDRADPLSDLDSMPGLDVWYYGNRVSRDSKLDYSMWPYPDLFWPRLGGLLDRESISTEEVKVTWRCGDLSALSEWFPERMALRSDSFPLVGARWNLFASFDPNNVYSLFGINVRERKPPRPLLACHCDINFSYLLLNGEHVTRNIKCNFIVEGRSYHWKKRDFLLKHEIDKIFQSGSYMTCHILVKELTNEGAQITHSSSCSKDQLLPEDDEGLPMVSAKVFKDFKNLLQSGEGTDVTLQVQDQQFKAHRIIIAARSSVFAAMIQNDMQENATGVMIVEDCDPASFPVLLEFLYCGDTEQLSVENVFSLYKSASKYDVQDLTMRCLQFIKHNLSVETFCETLRISFEHPETNLLTVATEFFIKHFKQISSMPEWETFLSENPVKGNKLFIEASKITFQ